MVSRERREEVEKHVHDVMAVVDASPLMCPETNAGETIEFLRRVIDECEERVRAVRVENGDAVTIPRRREL